MESLFSKVITSLSLILSLVTGSFINININEINIKYINDDDVPIYRTINVENIGNQRATFQIINEDSWLFVYREYQTNATHVDISPGSAVNFIAEIYPNQLSDGEHKTEIEIRAVHINSGEILDVHKISVMISKNVVEVEEEALPTPTEMEEVLEEKPTPTPEVIDDISSPTVAPKATLAQTPTSISSPTPIVSSEEDEVEPQKSFIRSLFDLIKGIFF